MCRERREGAITCRCVVYFSEKVGVGSYVRNAEPYDDFGSGRPRTKRPLRLALVGIFATILTIFSIQSAGANHIHMHGGPFVGVVLGVTIDPVDPRTVFVVAHGGGVFRSKNGGASWTVLNEGLPNKQVFSLALHPKEPGKLYLGTDQGIFFSGVRGAKWRPLSRDLDKRNIRAIAIDPAEPDVLYAATDRGVFLGKKNRWRRNSIGIANDDVRALAVNPDGAVFAATFGGIYKKQRSDDRWQEVGKGLSDKRVRALALDPLSPEIVYAGTATSGVYKTINGGKSWQEYNRGLLNSTVLSLIRVPLLDQPVYVGTVDGIFKSNNGKNQWQSIGPDLPFTVSAIAYNPKQPRQLYAGSGGRLYVSSNGGKNWRESSSEINYFGTVSHSTKR